MASEIGVSRTPIREALLRLQERGLVQIIPRRGVIVAACAAGKSQEVRHLATELSEQLHQLRDRSGAVLAATTA